MKTSTARHGFTIIEVILVLAIAGLIFLMVFIALPSLRRSQRDTQRRNDAARLLSAVINYQSDHRNASPDLNTNFVMDYLGGFNNFVDPNGESYGLCIIRNGDLSNRYCTYTPSYDFNASAGILELDDGASVGDFLVLTKSKCDEEGGAKFGGGNGVTILYRLEGSGSVCLEG